MGLEIAHQQVINEPGKPVRVWKHEDYCVLRNKGIETIQSISLDLCKMKRTCLKADAFQKMYNLRFIDFYKSDDREPSKVYIPEGLDTLPEEIRFLYWIDYPLPYMPLNNCAENLVNLEMPNSNLQQLWNGDQVFPHLKSIDLEGSRFLTKLPDLSQAPNIKSIELGGCVNLAQIYSSSALAPRFLFFYDCKKLRRVNLAPNFHSESLFINCSYFDLKSLTFTKVTVRFFCSDGGSISGFRFKAESVPFEDMWNCLDINDCEVLKLLGQSVSPLLPFVRKICWLNIASSIESWCSNNNYRLKIFNFESSIWTKSKYTAVNLILEQGLMIEEERRLSVTKPSIVGRATREVGCFVEEEHGCEDHICDSMFKTPNAFTRWSLLTDLLLQESDIVRLPCGSPSLSSLKSLAESYCSRLQPVLDVTVPLVPEVQTVFISFSQEHNHSASYCAMMLRYRGSHLFQFLMKD